MKSPFAKSYLNLSKEAQKKSDEKRINSFLKDYEEVCNKHKLAHKPILRTAPDALVAGFVIAEYERSPQKSDKQIIT